MPKGGARPGAGRKPKPLSEKLAAGRNVGHRAIMGLDVGAGNNANRPEPPDYLSMTVKPHMQIPSAVDFFNRTVDWLMPTGCMHLVPPEIIGEYALAKYFMVDAALTLENTGMVAQKGDDINMTGFAKVFFECAKITSTLWDKIYAVVSHNSLKQVTNPEKQFMSEIFAGRRRGRGRPPKGKDVDIDGFDADTEDSDDGLESGEV